MENSADTSIVLPSFSPMGLLNVVFTDNTTNTNVSVTPGMNLTRERKWPIYLSWGISVMTCVQKPLCVRRCSSKPM